MSKNDNLVPVDAGSFSRRQFLRNTSITAGSAVAAIQFPSVLKGLAQDNNLPIKVGVIACGGRGAGAGQQAEKAAPNVQVVALADIFPEKVNSVKKYFPNAQHFFGGFDAYKKVLEIPEINYVILATPPGFRPIHFAAAVEAGKNIFTEKPVGVDSPGIRAFMVAGEKAKQKKLFVAAGTQRRHQASYVEAMQKIHEGIIGEIVYMRCYWNQGAIWHRGDSGENDMEKQLRNWYHYTWLCGDHVVEQHVHNIDICNWAMKGHPIRAVSGLGGRQALGNVSGQIFDHFAVEYEYGNGARMFSQCRQITGCDQAVDEHIHGTEGYAYLNNNRPIRIKRKDGKEWQPSAKGIDPYVQEHADLINAIRSGNYMNEAQTVAESTFTAIMGREATYSGKMQDWDALLKCEKSIVPQTLDWGPAPKVEVAMPGKHNPC